MKDFFNRNKVLIGIIIITAVLLVGGVFLFTKNGENTNQTGKTVNMALLIPQNAVATSGFENGVYLPATPSATVTLVEFGDYECPACGVYSPFVKKLLTDFSGKITYVFRNYPLPRHKNAPISSYAVEAAGLQGKYWEMHEKMFASQNDWSSLPDPKEVFASYAKDLGLDINKFTADINSSAVKDKVQNDLNDGNTIGLIETPTFYLNGQKVTLSGTYDQFKALVQSALSK